MQENQLRCEFDEFRHFNNLLFFALIKLILPFSKCLKKLLRLLIYSFMNAELAKLVAEEQMAKAIWLSCKRRLDEYNKDLDQKKKTSHTTNRVILKRMKQMTRTI